jgi:hypothetical protein
VIDRHMHYSTFWQWQRGRFVPITTYGLTEDLWLPSVNAKVPEKRRQTTLNSAAISLR